MATRKEKPPAASAEKQEDVKIRVKRKRRRLYDPVPESEAAAVAAATAKPAAAKKAPAARKRARPAKARRRRAKAAPAEAQQPAAAAAKSVPAATDHASADRAARVASAQDLVKKYSLGTAAVGLVPLPLVDLVALSLLQGRMLKSLTELYDVEYSEQRAKIYTGALLSGATSVATAGRTGAMLGSLLKSVPAVGLVASASVMPAASGASTYALGKLFIQHFESGGTLLDFDPEKMRGYYEQQLAEAQARA